jgi:hypothetical protein
VCSASDTEHFGEHIAAEAAAAAEGSAFEIGAGRIAGRIAGVPAGSGSEAEPAVVHIDAAVEGSEPGIGPVFRETSLACRRLSSRSSWSPC